MDSYGYTLTNLSSQVKRFSAPSLSISSVGKKDQNGLMALGICIVLFIIVLVKF